MESIREAEKNSNPFENPNPFEDTGEENQQPPSTKTKEKPKKPKSVDAVTDDKKEDASNPFEEKNDNFQDKKSKKKSLKTKTKKVESLSVEPKLSFNSSKKGNEEPQTNINKKKSQKKKQKMTDNAQEESESTPKPPKRQGSLSIRKALQRGTTMPILSLPKSPSQSKLIVTPTAGENSFTVFEPKS